MPIEDRSTVKILIGNWFNSKYLISKAKRDLERMRSPRDFFRFYDSLMDFSVSIKHLAEWHWLEHVSHSSSNRFTSAKDYLKYLKSISGEFAAFDEIANTFKHGERKENNKLSKHIRLHPDYDGEMVDPELIKYSFIWTKGSPPKPFQVLPVLVTPGDENYKLFFAAEKVLDFWEKIIGK